MKTDEEAGFTRIVADSDVLAADLLVGGASRAALDTIRIHSWLELIATEPLLSDAQAVIGTLTNQSLASEWRTLIEELATTVGQPPEDHPALAAAYRGDAMHLISFDERMQSPAAGANLQDAMAVSVRSPDAFVAVFDPEAAYEATYESPYPGPDREPHA